MVGVDVGVDVGVAVCVLVAVGIGTVVFVGDGVLLGNIKVAVGLSVGSTATEGETISPPKPPLTQKAPTPHSTASSRGPITKPS